MVKSLPLSFNGKVDISIELTTSYKQTTYTRTVYGHCLCFLLTIILLGLHNVASLVCVFPSTVHVDCTSVVFLGGALSCLLMYYHPTCYTGVL